MDVGCENEVLIDSALIHAKYEERHLQKYLTTAIIQFSSQLYELDSCILSVMRTSQCQQEFLPMPCFPFAKALIIVVEVFCVFSVLLV